MGLFVLFKLVFFILRHFFTCCHRTKIERISRFKKYVQISYLQNILHDITSAEYQIAEVADSRDSDSEDALHARQKLEQTFTSLTTHASVRMQQLELHINKDYATVLRNALDNLHETCRLNNALYITLVEDVLSLMFSQMRDLPWWFKVKRAIFGSKVFLRNALALKI